MAERLITPKDFIEGAPPRIMGTEAEDHVSLLQSSDANKLQKSLVDKRAILKLLSPGTFQKAGIEARVNGIGRWLTNGQKLYPDGLSQTLFESCTAEQLGPKKALAGTLAGIRVAERLAEASELDVQIFRRTGTVNEEGRTSKAGFHMNHITPESVANRLFSGEQRALYTHSATRLFTWAGMVAPEGFVLSQKGTTSGQVNYRMKETMSGFTRIEDYSGDDASPWGTFMSMATTSVLLRVIEHPQEKDLNKRLAKLQLAGPHKAIQTVSADSSLREKLSLADNRRMTAVEIQKELATIASDFSKRYKLPEDEQYAVGQWLKVCEDLKEAAKAGDLKPLAERIGWVSKKLWLEKRVGKRLDASDGEAIRLDMSWDSYYPQEGGRLIFPKKTGLTIVSHAEIKALEDHPPQDTRGKVRGQFLKENNHDLVRIDWDSVVTKFPNKNGFRNVFFHPYQTEVQE